jgi:DNA-binding XRE family transcriptional regulator|nr:MAG TPA: repressor [Caudoviricetes sp.]
MKDYSGPQPVIHMAVLRKGLDIKKLVYERTIYGFVAWCHEIGISPNIVKLNRGDCCRGSTAEHIAKSLRMSFNSIFKRTTIKQNSWGNRFGYKLKHDEFKALLTKRKLNVQSAAEICGIHYVTLYTYLRNERVARFNTAVQISDGLKVPIETIFQVQDY